MPPGNIVRTHVLETEFAYIEDPVAAVLFRIRCCVPSVDLVATKADALYLARRTGGFWGGPNRFHDAVDSRCLDLPVLFGFLPGILESFSVQRLGIGLGRVCVNFVKYTTVRLRPDVILLSLVE